MSVRLLNSIQPESFAFNTENLAWAKKTIGKYPPSKEACAETGRPRIMTSMVDN